MTIESLRSFYDARPFRPFVLHLLDGRKIHVHERDFMAVAPKGSTVAVYQPDDSLSIIDLSTVTGLEVGSVAGVGRRRKRRS